MQHHVDVAYYKAIKAISEFALIFIALLSFSFKAAVLGELMFLDDDSLLEKMPLVKEDEKDDAGPLPVKVHIDATTL